LSDLEIKLMLSEFRSTGNLTDFSYNQVKVFGSILGISLDRTEHYVVEFLSKEISREICIFILYFSIIIGI
jgi:hypothetical protein